MSKQRNKICPICGAALDPDEICSCAAEQPVWDDATIYFEIEPQRGKPLTLAYRWAEDPAHQWNALTNENACGCLYNCTLRAALEWYAALAFFPAEAVDELQTMIEADLAKEA